MNTSLTDSSKTTKQIRQFIPHTSAKPQIPYALLLRPTRVYTRFLCHEPTYISVNIVGLCNSSKQINSSDLTLYFSKDSPDHRSKHSIKRSRKYIVISDLEIPLHHFLHRCIINSDQSIKNKVHLSRYSLEEFYHQQPLHMHTLHYDPLLLIQFQPLSIP